MDQLEQSPARVIRPFPEKGDRRSPHIRWYGGGSLALLGAWALGAGPWADGATAGDYFYVGQSAAGSYWSDTANWQPRSVPTFSDNLYFGESVARLRSTNDLTPDLFFRTVTLSKPELFLAGQPIMVRYLEVQNTTGTITLDLGLRPLDTSPGGLDINKPNAGGTLTISGDVENPDRTIRVTSVGQVNLIGVLSGTGALIKDGGGRMRMGGIGANTFTGQVHVRLGILELDKTMTFPTVGKIGRTAIAGRLTVGTMGSSVVSSVVVLRYNHQIANTAEVEVQQTGQLDLGGYDDTVGALSMSGGSVLTGAGVLTLDGSLTVTTAASVILGNLELGSASSRVVSVADPGELEVFAQVSGPADTTLSKQGDGILRLAGTNSYGGRTVVAAGVLEVAGSKALGGTGSGTVVSSGAELRLNKVTVQSESLTLNHLALLSATQESVWMGPVEVAGSQVTVAAASGEMLTIHGVLTGTGTIVKTNTGRLRLAGGTPNAFAGTLRVQAGAVELSKWGDGGAVDGEIEVGDGAGGPERDVVRQLGSNQLTARSRLILANSGLFDLNGYDALVSWVSGSGVVDLSDHALTVSNEVLHSFAGSIRGMGTVVKRGSSTWGLEGTNSYTGNTAVEGGTLLVNGQTTNSPMTSVSAGATLGGDGQVLGITLGSGGVLSPGNPVGCLEALGLVTLGGGSLVIELNGAEEGVTCDQLATGRAPDLTGGTLQIVLGFAPAPGTSFRIIDNRGDQAVVGTFAGLAEGGVLAVGGSSFRITYAGGTGNDVVLTVMNPPVPTLEAPQVMADGSLRIPGTGTAGFLYVLEVTSSLAPTDWTAVAQASAGATGLYEFAVAPVSGTAERYYRVRGP